MNSIRTTIRKLFGYLWIKSFYKTYESYFIASQTDIQKPY